MIRTDDAPPRGDDALTGLVNAGAMVMECSLHCQHTRRCAACQAARRKRLAAIVATLPETLGERLEEFARAVVPEVRSVASGEVATW